MFDEDDDAAYYQRHREKKLASVKARQAAIRAEGLGGSASASVDVAQTLL